MIMMTKKADEDYNKKDVDSDNYNDKKGRW